MCAAVGAGATLLAGGGCDGNMLEGYLSSYVLRLKGSPLVKEATVQKSVVEALQQNKAEGEVLHFVLNIKL